MSIISWIMPIVDKLTPAGRLPTMSELPKKYEEPLA
jgi:hypothetical protein